MAKTKLQQIDEQIAALQTEREKLSKSDRETKQKVALAKIAALKDQIDECFSEIESIAKEAEIDYVSFDGPSYGMGGYWSESGGWESSSASC